MVTDADAFAMVKELAAREGVLSGSSGGANVAPPCRWLAGWDQENAWSP